MTPGLTTASACQGLAVKVGAVEVLIRYQCQRHHQPDVLCLGCNGNGYVEIWEPHFFVRDATVRLINLPFVITGYRETHDPPAD